METTDTVNTPPPPPLLADIEKAQTAFKAALLQLGLILRFHRDVKALGVDNYAAHAPRSLSDALKEAMNNYRDACDAMELTIMRARNAIVQEILEQDPSLQSNDNSTALKQDGPSATVQTQTSDATDTAQVAETGTNPTTGSSTTFLTAAETGDMEDLFGPGTGSTSSDTSPTFNPNPAAGNTIPGDHGDTQAPLPDLSAFGLTSLDTIGDTSGNPGMGIDLSQLGIGMGLDLSSTSTNALPDASSKATTGIDMSSFGLPNDSSIPDFSSNSLGIGGMDTSQLEGVGGGETDFNALLASLSGGGGGGDGMLQGLENFDLTGILGDPTSQQQL